MGARGVSILSKQSLIGIVVASVIFAVGIIAALVLWSTSSNPNDPAGPIQQEIAGWAWGTYPRICPPVQLQCGPSLSREQCADVWKAAAHNERELDRKLYTQAKASPLVVVHATLPSSVNEDDICKGRAAILGHLGRTYRSPEWGKHIERFDVLVCFGLIREAQGWRDTSIGAKKYEAIKTVARLGNVGHVAHELLHVYMGDRVGHSHPKHGAGLMAEKPTSMGLGPVVRGLFAQRTGRGSLCR